MADVHAVIVRVKSAQLEAHAHDIRDGTAVLDAPSLVVAGGGDPSVGVGIVLPHQSSGLLGKGLSRRCPVFQRDKLLK